MSGVSFALIIVRARRMNGWSREVEVSQSKPFFTRQF